MCFSAQASYAVAAGLVLISSLSFSQTRTNFKLQLLALAPLFFAIQQVCEGIVWITLNNNDTASSLHHIGAYGFLFFAYIFWPLSIPIGLGIIEPNNTRKFLLRVSKFFGSVIAFWFIFSVILHGVQASIVGNHIRYTFSTSEHLAKLATPDTLYTFFLLLYFIAAVIPLYISSIRWLWLLGVAISISLIYTYFYYTIAFTSIWCFFAALSSIFIYIILRAQRSSLA